DGSVRDTQYFPIKGRTRRKTPMLDLANCLRKVEEAALDASLFDNISRMRTIEDLDTIDSVYGLLLFRRRFVLDGNVYDPSNGECSMLNLHCELEEEKDVYLLDEPEKSLGNEYINDVIIPLINEKARQGKKVFISTHDANIAVRTLP